MSKACCSIEEGSLEGNGGKARGTASCCSGGLPQGEPHGHSHGPTPEKSGVFPMFLPALISLALLLSALCLDHLLPQAWFQGWPRILWYGAAYLPVGLPVVRDALHSIRYNDFFSEFLLMSIATFGAFALGEYPEAVAVMLFYSVGEAFQDLAVRRAKGNIKALLDQRPDQVTVLRG